MPGLVNESVSDEPFPASTGLLSVGITFESRNDEAYVVFESVSIKFFIIGDSKMVDGVLFSELPMRVWDIELVADSRDPPSINKIKKTTNPTWGIILKVILLKLKMVMVDHITQILSDTFVNRW